MYSISLNAPEQRAVLEAGSLEAEGLKGAKYPDTQADGTQPHSFCCFCCYLNPFLHFLSHHNEVVSSWVIVLSFLITCPSSCVTCPSSLIPGWIHLFPITLHVLNSLSLFVVLCLHVQSPEPASQSCSQPILIVLSLVSVILSASLGVNFCS